MSKESIGFIGGGNMAEAIINGLLSEKVPFKIFVSDVKTDRLKYLSKKYKVKTFDNNVSLVKKSDIVILSVKPQVMSGVLSEISSYVKKKHLVISIAAGIKKSSIKKYLKNSKVIRVMPNNPALIKQGITAISIPSKNEVKSSDVAITKKIFESVGQVVFVKEELMDAVTALSGSGPGFIYYFVEAMIEGGLKCGLSYYQAKELAQYTLLGSAKTLIKSNKNPVELRSMVTSKGGTTQAGLEALDLGNFKQTVVNAIVCARNRARELSGGFK